MLTRPGARTAELLSWLSEGSRDAVLEGASRVTYPAGSIAGRASEPVDIYLIESGCVRLFTSTPDGRQASFAYLHPPELFGAAGALHGRGALVNLQILMETTLLRLDSQRLERLFSTNAEVAGAVARNLAAHLAHALHIITVRSLGSMRERLAYDLLDRACATQLRTGQLLAEVTNEDLAHSIGSAREVVTRILGDFRRAGIVVTSPGMVRVVDVPRLTAIVRGFVT